MRKFIALVFVLLFVLCLPLALLSYNIGRVVFDRDLVKRVVTKEVTESDLLPVALEWLSLQRAQERVRTGEAQTGVREPDVVKAIQYLNRDHWRKIKAEVLPNQLLAWWTSAVVDGVYDWIDSSDVVPNITLDFKPWKDYVRGPRATNAVQILYDAMPPCKQAEIDDFQRRLKAAPPGTKVLYNLGAPCAFPNPWRPDQMQQYRDGMNEVVNNVPDKFALSQELARIEKQQGIGAEAIKQQLRVMRLAAVLGLFVPLILLVLIALFGIRSFSGAGLWIGLPLMVGGLLCLLPALVLPALIGTILTAGPMSEVPSQVRTEFIRAFGVLLGEILQPMLLQSLVIVFVGLVLAVVGFVVGFVVKPKPVSQ
jgi:hypothetical protein